MRVRHAAQASSSPPAPLPAGGAGESPLRRRPLLQHEVQQRRLQQEQKQQAVQRPPTLATDMRSGLGHSMSFDHHASGGLPAAAAQGLWQRLRAGMRTATARLLYRYYCWRRDTFSDLQLLLALSAVLFLAGALVEGAVMRGQDTALDSAMADAGSEAPGWWVPLYAVSRFERG